MMPEKSLEKINQESKKYIWHFLVPISLKYISIEYHYWRYRCVLYLLIKHNIYIISTARRKPYLPTTKAYVYVQSEQHPDGWEKKLTALGKYQCTSFNTETFTKKYYVGH
jgi:hypothetical protein